MCAVSSSTGIPLTLCLREREGHVFFKPSVSSLTVSISGLTPLCFFHEGLAFTLSLIMLSYDNRIKRKNTESCLSGVLYAHPHKQLVLRIVLQLACPQPHPFYVASMLNLKHEAVWSQQTSPAQQPSTVKEWSVLPRCNIREQTSLGKYVECFACVSVSRKTQLQQTLVKMFSVYTCVFPWGKGSLHSVPFSMGLPGSLSKSPEAVKVLTCLVLCCARHLQIISFCRSCTPERVQ